MFAARGLALSFAFFFLLYVFLSAVVVLGSRFFVRNKRSADFLFGLRILPLAASWIVTLGLIVPSYALLEPHRAGEGIGAIPLLAGLLGLLLLTAGTCKALIAQIKTSRIVSRWMKQSTAIAKKGKSLLFCVRATAPPLSLAGIARARILISEAAIAVLTRSELETALRHEAIHARRRDNLRKLLFAFCAFPGMAPLEEAWREAAELAADDAAVRNPHEGLDLASALVKLSRLGAGAPRAELTTALVQNSPTLLDARVKRLVEWKETTVSSKLRPARWFALASGLGMIVVTVVLYSPVLTQVHELSEWLVR
ncbi:MAG TPA: M56 family metallopeptidase [Terriglobales bacterium]|nr:M56 family metallopeptidase [Terriglobales bacterium]